MTDLEMTRLCAEALGYCGPIAPLKAFVINPDGQGDVPYDPLHDDAQAMALVKKLGLCIYYECLYPDSRVVWIAIRLGEPSTKISNSELNRAIVECVAKMQSAKCSNS